MRACLASTVEIENAQSELKSGDLWDGGEEEGVMKREKEVIARYVGARDRERKTGAKEMGAC